MVASAKSDNADDNKILLRGSRKIKNRLPVTWIGKLSLDQDALVVFNCTALNVQRDKSCLATLASIVVDSEYSAYNAVPALKVDKIIERPKCSVSLTVFLEKGEHRFEMKGWTAGESLEPSKGQLSYDYCAIALPDKPIPISLSKERSKKKTTKKKTPKKKTAKKEVAEKKVINKKTARKKSKKKTSKRAK